MRKGDGEMARWKDGREGEMGRGGEWEMGRGENGENSSFLLLPSCFFLLAS